MFGGPLNLAQSINLCCRVTVDSGWRQSSGWSSGLSSDSCYIALQVHKVDALECCRWFIVLICQCAITLQ